MELVNVRTPAWLEGMSAPAVEGTFGRLQRTRVQGIPALVTPSWALDCGAEATLWTPQDEASVREAMRVHRAGLAVYDLPAGTALADEPFAGSFVERHTRIADLSDALPKHRLKQARKAQRMGMQVAFDRMDIPQMVRLHQLARSRKSIPSDAAALTRLLTRLSKEAGAMQAFVLDAAGLPIAGGVFLATRPGEVLYAFGGAERSEHSGLATVLLLVEAMERAAVQGSGRFDFGGSQDPGVDQFYREFGGERVVKYRGVLCRPQYRVWLRIRRPDLFR